MAKNDIERDISLGENNIDRDASDSLEQAELGIIHLLSTTLMNQLLVGNDDILL